MSAAWRQRVGVVALAAVVGTGAGAGTAWVVTDHLLDERVDERVGATGTADEYVRKDELGQVLNALLTPVANRLTNLEHREFRLVDRCTQVDSVMVTSGDYLAPGTPVSICVEAHDDRMAY